MPTLLRVRGLRFFFFSMESMEPAHVHVAHAEQHAKFWLDPVGLAEVHGFRANELTEVRKLVIEHRKLFLEKWHEYFGGKS